jgi:hypothetical protein
MSGACSLTIVCHQSQTRLIFSLSHAYGLSTLWSRTKFTVRLFNLARWYDALLCTEPNQLPFGLLFHHIVDGLSRLRNSVSQNANFEDWSRFDAPKCTIECILQSYNRLHVCGGSHFTKNLGMFGSSMSSKRGESLRDSKLWSQLKCFCSQWAWPAIGRSIGAPTLGHREAGASAQVVIPCF